MKCAVAKVGEHAVGPAGVSAGGHLPRHPQPTGHSCGPQLDTGPAQPFPAFPIHHSQRKIFYKAGLESKNI